MFATTPRWARAASLCPTASLATPATSALAGVRTHSAPRTRGVPQQSWNPSFLRVRRRAARRPNAKGERSALERRSTTSLKLTFDVVARVGAVHCESVFRCYHGLCSVTGGLQTSANLYNIVRVKRLSPDSRKSEDVAITPKENTIRSWKISFPSAVDR
jgi:hypothetical protein